MVVNINKLKGKITENGYNMKTLSQELNLCETTLRRKINESEHDFYLGESLIIKEKLKLTTKDYIDIFYGNNLN